MSTSPILLLTGGGTAGHVAPNLALLPVLQARGFQVEYVGSRDGMERELSQRAGLPYHAVQVGKLRRYASVQNLLDPFRTLLGVVEAVQLMRRLRPSALFSKGGFVGVPPVVAAWLCRIPAIVHESDLSPGLANRLCFPFAARVCVTFEETLAQVPRARGVHTGTPIRRELLAGDAARARARWKLSPELRTLVVFGGSQGARALNDVVRALVRADLAGWQVLHVCGPGNLDPELDTRPGYHQFEYLHGEWPDALACADAVLCRGGANSLVEMVALRKLAIVVPLPAVASRGDQLENARRFAQRGYGLTVAQEELTAERLRAALQELLRRAPELSAAMQRDAPFDSAERIADLLDELIRARAAAR
jgi:UDP-N-acetylglucosamine--N-acetylmuramyl-(pentapeptide) pyrophosphoryl-undecaprenol N-acetylglucosamine transferase